MRAIFATFLLCGLFLASYGKQASSRVTAAKLMEPIKEIQQQIVELTQVVKQLVENQQQMQQLIQQQSNHNIQQNQQQMHHAAPQMPNYNVHQNQQHKIPHKPNHSMNQNQQPNFPQKPNHNMQQNQHVSPQQPNHNIQQIQPDYIGSGLGMSCININMGQRSNSQSIDDATKDTKGNVYQRGNIIYLNEHVLITAGQNYVCKTYAYRCDITMPDPRFTLVESGTC